MPIENNIKLGPGTIYFQTPEGLQPLGSVTEATVIEAEEMATGGWLKEKPYITTAADATFTAEVKISPDAAKALTTAGAIFAIANGVNFAKLLKISKVQAALNEAPPRVRHLARHGKKYRTRKKNINRALRDYERSRKRDRP